MCSIVEAGPGDAAEIAEFLQRAYVRAYAGRHGITATMFTNVEFRRRTTAALRERLGRPDIVLLALRDPYGALVATIGLRPDGDDDATGEVWGFYVDSTRQGHGLGRALWEALMADSRTRDYEQLYLHVIVGSDAAAAFYRRRGFVADGDEGSWNWPAADPPVRTPYRTMRRGRAGSSVDQLAVGHSEMTRCKKASTSGR